MLSTASNAWHRTRMNDDEAENGPALPIGVGVSPESLGGNQMMSFD